MESYTYDAHGNLLTFNNGITTHIYTYVNSEWKDLLTAVDGEIFIYDEIGNPTSYYNGSRYSLGWTEGRKLATITEGGKTTDYLYDAGGNRIKKINDDDSYIIYVNVNGVPLGEKHYSAEGELTKTLRYIYDENGSVCGYIANSADGAGTYHFIKNLQGDVTHVYRLGDNAIVASYSYDSWGNIISATGEKAEENPFRYRGYYYDVESGFYATGSRYYDPEIGRFINADDVSMLGANGDFASLNLYAYCGNNPITRADETGHFWGTIGIGFVAGVIGQYVSDVITNINSGATGAAIFAPTSSVSDYLASGIGGAFAAIPGLNLVGTMAVGAVGSVASDAIKGNINSLDDLGKSVARGAISNGIGYGVAKAAAAIKVKQIGNMSRSAKKAYLRDEFYCNTQADVNMNLRTFSNSSLSTNIKVLETNVNVFRLGVYSTTTSTVVALF